MSNFWVDGSSARDLSTSYQPRNPSFSVEYVNIPRHITSKQLDEMRVQSRQKQISQSRAIAMGLTLAQQWLMIATCALMALAWTASLLVTLHNLLDIYTLYSFGLMTSSLFTAMLLLQRYYRYLDRQFDKLVFINDEDILQNKMLGTVFWFVIMSIGLLAIILPNAIEMILAIIPQFT